MSEATRQMLILLSLSSLFFIFGGWFGIIKQQVGLPSFAPMTGDIARAWGAIMCSIGAVLLLIAVT